MEKISGELYNFVLVNRYEGGDSCIAQHKVDVSDLEFCNTTSSISFGETSMSKQKMCFEKGYEETFTREIFTIFQIIQGNPKVFKLKDLAGEKVKGTFYAQDL